VWGIGEVRTGFFVGKPEGRRSLGRPRCRRGYKFKIGLQEVVWGRKLDWLRIRIFGQRL